MADKGSDRAHIPFPPIPDLRFEYSYLKSLAPYIHTRPAIKAAVSTEKTHDEEEDPGEESLEVEGGRELVKLDWGHIAWVTTRDQVISPLLQGIIFGFASQLLRPFVQSLWDRLRGHPAPKDLPPRPRPVSAQKDGELIDRLRSWSRTLSSGSGEVSMQR